MKAQLFTRYANGLQAWPDDHTTIEVPANSYVETRVHPITKDAVITVYGQGEAADIELYIPRGGSVVIEVAQ